MYAIVNVIYGIPLHTNSGRTYHKWSGELDEAFENEDPGFLQYYSGGGPEIPAAFGIELGSTDEARHHTELSELNLEPTDEQKAEFTTLWDNLSADLKDEISKHYGEPRVFLLWSTS